METNKKPVFARFGNRPFGRNPTVFKPALPAPSPVKAPVSSKPTKLDPWRLWVAKGRSKTIVILDDTFGPNVREHNFKNKDTGRFDCWEPCVGDADTCPLCEDTATYGNGRYSVVLTCTDLSATGRDPRRLINITSKAFHSFLSAYLNEHGSLRGLKLELNRAYDDRSALGTPTIVSVAADITRTAYDYAELFPKVTAADLRAKFGGEPPAGSKEDIQRYLKTSSDLEDVPY